MHATAIARSPALIVLCLLAPAVGVGAQTPDAAEWPPESTLTEPGSFDVRHGRFAEHGDADATVSAAVDAAWEPGAGDRTLERLRYGLERFEAVKAWEVPSERGPLVLSEALSAVIAQAEEAGRVLGDVWEEHDARWGPCAGFMYGRTLEELARQLGAAPPPAGLDPAAIGLYGRSVALQAEALLGLAVDVWRETAATPASEAPTSECVAYAGAAALHYAPWFGEDEAAPAPAGPVEPGF